MIRNSKLEFFSVFITFYQFLRYFSILEIFDSDSVLRETSSGHGNPQLAVSHFDENQADLHEFQPEINFRLKLSANSAHRFRKNEKDKQ